MNKIYENFKQKHEEIVNQQKIIKVIEQVEFSLKKKKTF